MNAPTAPTYINKFVVRRVVDGDTIDGIIDLGYNVLIHERVRLYDVDTPEAFGAKADPRGKLATAFTDLWLCGGRAGGAFLSGILIDSRRYDARCKYGRVLADVYRPHDPVSLNRALIEAGLLK